MGDDGLSSEYERRRLENIRRNQQVLRSLHIPKLPAKDGKEKSHIKRERRAKGEGIEPSRRSSRIIARRAGIVWKEGPGKTVDVGLSMERTVRRRPKPPPRRSSSSSTAAVFGAAEEFLSMVVIKEHPSGESYNLGGPCKDDGMMGHDYRVRGEDSVVKASRDRFYSIAIHPGADRLLVAGGTKEGELVFWDANVDGSSGDDGKRRHQRCYRFDPHRGSISNLKYRPNDPYKLLTTSYDGSCLTMDLNGCSFTPWFACNHHKGAVVTGFDTSPDGRLALHSDTQGFLRITDLVAGRVIEERQLHETKIGGISVSLCNQNRLATCSNDRSIALWDLRALGKNLDKWEYRNAVTSVAYHPAIEDCLVSTCYDDHIRIHRGAPGQYEVVSVPHNNRTGRWVTLFKAVWDPRSTAENGSLLCIGNMEQRGVDFYNVEGRHLGCAVSEWVTAQPAVNAFHPVRRVVASGNASGKMVIWTCE